MTQAIGRRVLLPVWWAVGLLAGPVCFGAEVAETLRSAHFSLAVPADARRLGRRVLETAEAARKTVLDQMPEPLDERVSLVWCPTEREFEERIGGRLGNALAVAVPSVQRIYLNGPQVRRIEPRQIHQTLVHEFMHVYLGQRIPREIPLWLNEGLAMAISNEWGLDDATALAADGLFHAVFTPEDLAREFPADPGAQRRAYRQSRSMTAFLIELRFAETGLRGLVADLGQPSGQSALGPLLFDPDWQARFYEDWRRRKVRPGQLTLFLTSSGTLWMALTLLLLLAYRRKRRARRRREARWAWEEEWGYHDDGFDD